MISLKTLDNGSTLAWDPDRIASIAAGNGDPGEGPICTLDGNNVEVYALDGTLSGDGTPLDITSGGNASDGLQAVKDTANFTTAPSASYGGGTGGHGGKQY